jgi:predicted dehydrogenase
MRGTLAFLGCGAITARHTKTLIALRPDAHRGYASRDAAKAASYASRFRGKAYASYDEALDDEGVAAAFIALPPRDHFEWARKALRRGKHVIVEKPPFVTVSELDEVAAAAREVGRRVLVAENYYYKPITVRLRELIRAGAVGEVLFVHVNALKTQQVSGWRASEGALLEGGIHWINFMSSLGLEVRSARAQRAGRGGVDRSAVVTFEYEGGAAGTLLYSWEVPSTFGLRMSRIYGREGSIAFESNGAFLLATGKTLRLAIAPGLSDAGGARAMFDDFIRAIDEDREPEMSLERARKDLAIATSMLGQRGE